MNLAVWKLSRRRTSLVVVARQIRRWTTYTRMAATSYSGPVYDAFKETR